MAGGGHVENMGEQELKPLGLPLEVAQLRVNRMYGNPLVPGALSPEETEGGNRRERSG